MSNLMAILLTLAGLVAPGYLLTRRWVPRADLFESAVYTVAIGLLVVPPVAFVASWTLGVPMGIPLVLSVAAALCLVCRPWSLGPRPPIALGHVLMVLVLAGASVGLVFATGMRLGVPGNLFETCLHRLALHLMGGEDGGLPMLSPESGRQVVHLVNRAVEPVLGLAPLMEEQRPANGAVLAVLMSLGGRMGLENLTWMIFFVVSGAATLAVRSRFRFETTALVVGLAVLVGSHGLMAYMVNSSTFALTAGMVVTALLVRPGAGPRERAVAGVALGLAVGSRLAALLWLLPVWLILRRNPAVSRWTLWVGFLASVLPWLLVPWMIHGDPFYHPSPVGTLVSHDFFGLSLTFRPLNWPFVPDLVRVPGQVLPPLLLLPVLVVRSAGALLAAAALVGFVLTLGRRGLRMPMLAGAVPIAAFLSLLTYVDYEKASWLLLAVPAAPFALAAFLEGAFTRGRRLPMLVTWVACAAGLSFLPGILAGIELPLDQRRYQRVSPDVEPPGRTEAAQRLELGEPRWLPSLQRDHLEGQSPGRSVAGIESGSRVPPLVLVHLDHRDPAQAAFEVPATREPPPLPPVTQPGQSALFGAVEELLFAVHLRADLSERTVVHLAKVDDVFHVALDPGPPPHEPRTVSFLVDDHWSGGLKGVSVAVSGRTLPVRVLGYRVNRTDGAPPVDDPRVVTNLALPPPEPSEVTLRAGGVTGRYRWGDLGQ